MKKIFTRENCTHIFSNHSYFVQAKEGQDDIVSCTNAINSNIIPKQYKYSAATISWKLSHESKTTPEAKNSIPTFRQKTQEASLFQPYQVDERITAHFYHKNTHIWHCHSSLNPPSHWSQPYFTHNFRLLNITTLFRM